MIPKEIHDQFVTDLEEFKKDISKLKKAEIVNMCAHLKLMMCELAYITLDTNETERQVKAIMDGDYRGYVDVSHQS